MSEIAIVLKTNYLGFTEAVKAYGGDDADTLAENYIEEKELNSNRRDRDSYRFDFIKVEEE